MFVSSYHCHVHVYNIMFTINSLDLCVQHLAMTWKGDIRAKGRDLCFDVPNHDPPAHVILYVCHGMRGNQHFTYNLVSIASFAAS